MNIELLHTINFSDDNIGLIIIPDIEGCVLKSLDSVYKYK